MKIIQKFFSWVNKDDISEETVLKDMRKRTEHIQEEEEKRFTLPLHRRQNEEED